MSLKKLINIGRIGDFPVNHIPNKSPGDESIDYFVSINRDENSIKFTLQNGPIQEKGVNGCQVETLIHAAKTIIKTYNDDVPCRENSLAITKLEEAIHWLEARTKDRQQRGVEGTNQI